MKSIRLKMVIMYLVLAFIVVVTCGSFTIVSLRVTENRNAESRLGTAADKVKGAIIDVYPEEEYQRELRSLMRPDASVSQIEYYILDRDFTIVATNMSDSVLSVSLRSVSVIISALAGSSDFQAGRKHTNLEGVVKQWMEYARPESAADGAEYVIYLRIDATESFESIRQTTLIFVMGLLIALVLAVILGTIFAESVNKPIVLLTRKAKEFAKGDLTQDIEVQSGDEIGQLSQSFNHMAHELKETLSVFESEKNKLEVVLHNVTDGVLAYDAKGRLMHANRVCGELLDTPDIEKLSLMDMLKRFELGVKIDENGVQSIEDAVLHINGRYINVVCSYYHGRGSKSEAAGVILLLQDLTKHIMLDNMRKEFVANVSHELRTPLTTIKSYTETLLEELPDASLDKHFTDFLSTVNSEADRMTILVNDLLELSRLDNKQLEFNLQTVSLSKLVAQNVANHRHTLNKKGSSKRIVFEEPEIEMPVDVDHERINQVFNNIITNSLRYSGENTVVEVTIEDTGEFYRVSIKDNGMGIPREDLGRIFERFYRVDKARSRELGGTGLGLSISKEIVESHGGRLSAESELGVGTTMIVELLKSDGALGC